MRDLIENPLLISNEQARKTRLYVDNYARKNSSLYAITGIALRAKNDGKKYRIKQYKVRSTKINNKGTTRTKMQ